MSEHLDAAEIERRLVVEFPQAFGPKGSMHIEAAALMRARLRLAVAERHLRPGNTISGPAMFELADCALYVAVLATVGWIPLAATTSLTLNFLARPQVRDLVADSRLLRVGRTLAVGEVSIRSQGGDTILAHATGTYVLPRHTTVS